MFSISKPTASLSSGLLARKGQARPAMRPQGFHGPDAGADDLGWNDMGDEPAPAPEIVAIQPAVEPAVPIPPEPVPVPPVLVERATLREEIEVAASPAPVSAAAVARIGREVRAVQTKAAFTLRLEPGRHLRLRLASASRNRSAQALVVEALDAFIASLPEVEGLVAQLSTKKTAKRDRKP